MPMANSTVPNTRPVGAFSVVNISRRSSECIFAELHSDYRVVPVVDGAIVEEMAMATSVSECAVGVAEVTGPGVVDTRIFTGLGSSPRVPVKCGWLRFMDQIIKLCTLCTERSPLWLGVGCAGGRR